MGFGDEIMAGGHAKVVAETVQNGKVMIVDRHGNPRWDEMWQGLPWIVTPAEQKTEIGQQAIRLPNAAFVRPYIKYPFTREAGCTYSGWRARDYPGEIRFNDAEREFGLSVNRSLGPYIVIEPNISEKHNPNKQWGWDRWQEFADLISNRGTRLLQVGPKGSRVLRGADLLETPTFRLAATVLDNALLSILPEGGLHHAAAALRRDAIVLFGGAVDVNATGYPWHTNIVDQGDGSPCGKWLPCDHCAECWSRIRPAAIADLVEDYLG